MVEPPSPGGYLSFLSGQFLLDRLSVREFIEARICIERNAVRLAVARAGAEDVAARDADRAEREMVRHLFGVVRRIEANLGIDLQKSTLCGFNFP